MFYSNPFCFNVYINKSFSFLPENNSILRYADDLIIFSANADPDWCRRTWQSTLATISSRLKSLQFTFSVNSSFVKVFDFLWFVLRAKLSPAARIDKIAKQCFPFTNILKSICGISCDPDSFCMIKLYLGLVRLRLEYACSLVLDIPNKNFLKV